MKNVDDVNEDNWTGLRRKQKADEKEEDIFEQEEI